MTFPCVSTCSSFGYALNGYYLRTEQPGKNVLAMIFDVWPLVRVLDGRKYGLFWSSHGSAGALHGYPLITPGLLMSKRSTNRWKVLPTGTSVKVNVVGAGSLNPAALDTILVSCPRVALAPGLK